MTSDLPQAPGESLLAVTAYGPADTNAANRHKRAEPTLDPFQAHLAAFTEEELKAVCSRMDAKVADLHEQHVKIKDSLSTLIAQQREKLEQQSVQIHSALREEVKNATQQKQAELLHTSEQNEQPKIENQ